MRQKNHPYLNQDHRTRSIGVEAKIFQESNGCQTDTIEEIMYPRSTQTDSSLSRLVSIGLDPIYQESHVETATKHISFDLIKLLSEMPCNFCDACKTQLIEMFKMKKNHNLQELPNLISGVLVAATGNFEFGTKKKMFSRIFLTKHNQQNTCVGRFFFYCLL